ncbi:hypothetical protein [Gemmata sp.]|uniref:hypothetical protein n=1 Tax=Gemmata sp. TaxID=1914242 RepID=UPI003F70AB5E
MLFRGPNCEESLDPTPDEVFAVMALPYDEHWGYQPVAELQWHDPSAPTGNSGSREPETQLILIKHPDWGWYFEYSRPAGPAGAGEWLAPLDPTGPPGHALHWCWGETQWYRAASFVPEGPAHQVVADFMATGRPSPAVAWASAVDIESRLQHDEYAERYGSAPDAEPGTAPVGRRKAGRRR